MVATGHEDGRVRLWHTANRVARAKAEASTTSAPVAALAHDTAARALVVLPRSGEPRRLDARTLAPLPAYAPLPARRADSPMALARDRAIVALVGADGRVLRWDLDRGRVLAAVAPRVADPVASLTLTPDGGNAAIAHASGRVLFWRAGSDHLATLIDGASLVPGVAFSPDGGFLAVMSQVTAPQLWRLQGLSRVPLDVAEMSSYVQNAPQLGVGARQLLTVCSNPDNVWLWMLGAQRPRPLKLDLEPGALSVARDGLSFDRRRVRRAAGPCPAGCGGGRSVRQNVPQHVDETLARASVVRAALHLPMPAVADCARRRRPSRAGKAFAGNLRQQREVAGVALRAPAHRRRRMALPPTSLPQLDAAATWTAPHRLLHRRIEKFLRHHRMRSRGPSHGHEDFA